MKMVYPMQTGSRDTPKELASPEEFIAKLAAEPGGTFLLGNNRSWHGGIHLGNQNGWHPDGAVRAIADGQIVAYRLADTPVELTLPAEAHQPGDAIRVQTSPSFCLLRHSYEAKEGSHCNRLTFYSLYMHLACQRAYQGEPERWVLSGQGVNIYNAAAQGEQFSATDRLGTARHGAEVQIHGQPVERSNARNESHSYQLASYRAPQSGDPQAFYIAVQHIKAERKAQPAWMTPPASKPERYATRGNAWLRAAPSSSTVGLLGLPAHSEVVVMSEPSRRVTLNGSPTELVKVEVFKAVSGPVTDSAGHPMTHATAGAQGWLAKRLLGQRLAAETSVAIVPNRVVDRLSQPIAVQAGELIGHWGEGGSIRLTASGYQSNNAPKMVHIETFVASSDKAALQQCVANAGRLSGGQAYLLLEEGKSVSTFRLENNSYTEASEFGPLAAPYPIKEQDRVTQNSNKFVKVAEDEHVLLVGKSEVVSQHDWEKLGVGLFDGSQDQDGFLEKAETENQEGSAFFTALYNALVTDRDGDEQLTASDIQQTLRDPKLAHQIRHLFICHQSEWVKRRDWPRLKQELEARPKLYDYMLELNNKLAWIEDASAILGDTKPWFIHPAGMMGLVGRTSSKRIDIDLFINEYKKIHSIWDSQTHSFIALPLNSSSERGLTHLMRDFNSLYAEFDDVTLQRVSYMLATAKLESYNYLNGDLFNPISELGGDHYAEEMYDPALGRSEQRRQVAINLGNTTQGDGIKYKGRGFVQITGKNNYIKFSRILSLDLENNPEITLELGNAFSIMVLGMRDGIFTGHKLSDYISSESKDYRNSRRIINGMNETNTIATYAEEFELCLLKSRV